MERFTRRGAARSASEFRIQVTGIDAFTPQPHGECLILGWFDELGVFAAFDARFHTGPLGNSPSIQIGRDALSTAAMNGIAPYQRGNGELAIAVRFDMLPAYIEHLNELHGFGTSDTVFQALDLIATDPDSADEAVAHVESLERKRVLVTTARLLRDARFRERILSAYGHACAFCGVQLELLDAAHILPVNHPDSTDDVKNGVALCSLHHRAYDRALVTFDHRYRIFVNGRRVERLKAHGRSGGELDFRAGLAHRLRLPENPDDYPDVAFVAMANELRSWTPDDLNDLVAPKNV